jgi:hypothetical protein
LLAIPDDQGAGAGQVPESLESPLGLTVLVDGDAHDHENETQEHQGFFQLSHPQVEGPAGDQKQEHGFPGHFQHNGPDATLLSGREFVVSLLFQAPGGFHVREAGDGVKVEVFHR